MRAETFEEFRDSFSYGSRTDLSFKFLKNLPPDRAAEFLQLLIGEVGEVFDSASTDRIIDLVQSWQVDAYTPQPDATRPFTYDDRPFEPFESDITEATIGLVTSSGHFVDGDDPAPLGEESMTQEESIGRIDEFLRSTPSLSEIPRRAPAESLRVRHPGYDIRSAVRDPGVAFPRDALVQLEGEGVIGALGDPAYSFVGACAQGRIRREAPTWVERWRERGFDALLLVPV